MLCGAGWLAWSGFGREGVWQTSRKPQRHGPLVCRVRTADEVPIPATPLTARIRACSCGCAQSAPTGTSRRSCLILVVPVGHLRPALLALLCFCCLSVACLPASGEPTTPSVISQSINQSANSPSLIIAVRLDAGTLSLFYPPFPRPSARLSCATLGQCQCCSLR